MSTTSSVISFSAKDIDFVASFLRLSGFKSAQWDLPQKDVKVSDTGPWFSVGRSHFVFEIGPDRKIAHDLLSYGQKRLLAFLYYAAMNDDFLIADELVNGFHYAWIEACVHLMQNRQSFLATQNPLLLDFLPIESAEQVEAMFIQFQRDDEGTLSVTNLSSDVAVDLFADMQMGIQHTGEILRLRGLW